MGNTCCTTAQSGKNKNGKAAPHDVDPNKIEKKKETPVPDEAEEDQFDEKNMITRPPANSIF
jgi:hypothetical protein